MGGSNKVQDRSVTFYISQSAFEAAKAVFKLEGMTFSYGVRTAIKRFMEELKKEQSKEGRNF